MLPIQSKELQQYLKDIQSDPVLAVREVLGIELAPHQRLALKGMWTHPWTMLVWGRGTGKTFMDAVYAAISAAITPGLKIVLIGPGFRQAQFIFKYIEEFAEKSPVFRECIVGNGRGVKHATSEWRMDFKNGSWIVAVPLGTDGSKIRGYRANVLIVDETVQVPPEIIDRVILPFLSTNRDPMAMYLGESDEELGNTLIYTTSAFFDFNHAHAKYARYLREIYGEGSKDYFVSHVNYNHCPEGFINSKALEEARKQLTEADFKMEWEAEWVSDTVGFYPASLVAKCQSPEVFPELVGKKDGTEYVLGVDPASVYNTCGFTVTKIGSPNTIVHVKAFSNLSYPDICSRILEYMSNFNIVRIGLDRGAGIPILDLFKEGRPFTNRNGTTTTIKLLQLDDDSVSEGRRIIQTFQASSQSVTELNFQMKAAMESDLIKWPEIAGDGEGEVLEEKESLIEEFRQLESEYRMIEGSPTQSGWYTYSVPSHKNKDRYSSSLFSVGAAKRYVEDNQEQVKIILPTGMWGSNPRYGQGMSNSVYI